MDEVHRFRGCHVSYALRLQGPDDDDWMVYCGSTQHIAQRMMDHARGRGAKVTRAFPPTGEILHIKEHETAREALLCEGALWNLWAGKLGPERVRGGRWNQCGPFRFLPKEWTAPECPDFGDRRLRSRRLFPPKVRRSRSRAASPYEPSFA